MGEIAMRCYVCEATNWRRPVIQVEGKARPIHTEGTVQICNSCGNACFEVDVSKEESIKDYYRKEYRPQPNLTNIITTTHKQNYIRVFLYDLLKKAGQEGKQMVVGDVGAATGYLCNFFAKLGHKVTGCELTLTYRRMSEHYYGIPLTEELEPKHRYDLITVYHVLEHLFEPDKKLAHYASLLAPGGKIMVATPQWFETLEEASGPTVSSFDHLFHKNHVNLFSKTSIQNVFRKCGLRVVKEDFAQYGQTYLLEKAETPVDLTKPDTWLTREDPGEVERNMLMQFHAINLFAAGKYREAYEAYANFPDAWLAFIFNKCTKDLVKQTDTFTEAEKVIGGNFKFILARAQWYYQQGRLAEAIRDFQKVLQVKPNEDTLMFLGYALAQAGRPQEAIQAMQNAAAMHPGKWQEAHTWILSQVSQMPTWDERAQAEMQMALARQPKTPEPAVG